jgi:hypothetical protein
MNNVWILSETRTVILSKYPVNRTQEIERESFPPEHAAGAMMRALTYAILDTTREFACYEVTDVWGLILARISPRWMYDPQSAHDLDPTE